MLTLSIILCAALTAYYYNLEGKCYVESVQLNSSLVEKTLPYNVVLPPHYNFITSRNIRYPVLYLLHGWNGHYNSWIEQSALAKYASEHQIIVVTPEGNNSWYTDSDTIASDKYESYILQELIPDLESRYRTMTNRRGRAIAGYSMGGYGALKFGLKHPEVFAFVGSISGALDASSRIDDSSIMQTFGAADSVTRKNNDVQRLIKEFPVERIPQLPYFYIDCGSEDPWLASNHQLVELLQERKIVYEYHQLPGSHTWQYWDKQLGQILRTVTEFMAIAE